MKKAVLISFLLILSNTYAQEQQNLIKNGSFEDHLKHWTQVVENGAEANFSTDSKIKQIGSSALKAEVNALGKKTWNVQIHQNFASKKDKSYEVSFLAKSTSGSNEFSMLVQKETYTRKIFAMSNKWEVYSWHFMAKEDDLQLSIQFTQKGTFSIDNLIIKEIKTVKKKIKSIKEDRKTKDVNVITNGKFEKGYDNWDNMTENGGEAQFDFNIETPNEGKKSMRAEITKLGANPWDIQTKRNLNVKNNNRYLVTFYAKAIDEKKLIKVQIEDHEQEIYLEFEFVTNTGWEKHEFEFTSYSDSMTFNIHHISLGTIEYDNINIQKIKKKRK